MPDQHEATLPVVVDADWLARHLDEVALADVRWYLDGSSGYEAYLGGHLPGAVWIDVDHDLAAPPSPQGGRHPLPDPDHFARALGRRGIGDDTPVVAYDDAGGSVAARLVWMLRVLGCPAALLDGGMDAWQGPLERESASRQPCERTVLPWPAERVVDAATVLAATSDDSQVLLDARARGRFTGESPSAVDARPGHIPSARSAQWQDNLTPDGRLLSAEQLRARFTALGVTTAVPPIAYCGSGVTACHDLLALEHAGFAGARLYPGSWSAWGADPELPAETGDPTTGAG
ncbi:sulfurtransferase [Salinactinospora qingdaonensis]|uniref:Sulfurtransferase n=1 Tax=Salinactinospora qingdaonensis TaxID=702744 RepID=A0ABP7FY84_9ACTN